MALDATVGGASSNSFGTLEEANSFFEDRLYTSVWDATSDANKNKALITACSQICQLRFFGEKATSAQSLPWPRLCVKDPDGCYYASDEIPEPLKHAQFIYAHELLKSDSISEKKITGLKKLSTGTVDLEFEPALMTGSGKIPDEAMRLLRGLVMTGGRVTRA
jgi:hypothetical protein